MAREAVDRIKSIPPLYVFQFGVTQLHLPPKRIAQHHEQQTHSPNLNQLTKKRINELILLI